MIRHVSMLKLRNGVSDEEVHDMIEQHRALVVDGMHAVWMGRDLGLRTESPTARRLIARQSIVSDKADCILVADFEDVAAYRRFDLDPEHERIRAAAIGMVASGVRCQFRI